MGFTELVFHPTGGCVGGSVGGDVGDSVIFFANMIQIEAKFHIVFFFISCSSKTHCFNFIVYNKDVVSHNWLLSISYNECLVNAEKGFHTESLFKE